MIVSHCPVVVPKKSQQGNTPKRLIHKGLDLFCPVVPFFIMFIYINIYIYILIVIYKRIEKTMGQRDNIPQTLATTSLVSVPNNGTKGDNNGTNHYFFKKRTPNNKN